MEAPLSCDVDVGERQLGMNELQNETGDGPCAQESSRQVGRYEGYWDVTLRMPERPIPPPPKNMNDKEAVEKWRNHC
jgi:hypothetical protein